MGRPRRAKVAPNRHVRHDEQGSALLLALIYLVAVSVILGGLASWTMNDLGNTPKFAATRSLQTAASSAVQTAIQTIRYTPLIGSGQTLNANPPVNCWGSNGTTSEISVNGDVMAVWCSTHWSPTSAATRVVTFSSCQASVSVANCVQNPILEAIVTFDDYPSGVSAPTNEECVTYCGSSMTVNSWLWDPVLPTVSSLSTTSGSITGGTSLTITGTGFTSTSTVNFVDSTASDNYSVTATGTPTVVGTTSITVTTPPVEIPNNYYVTVTSPTGTSSAGPVFQFTLAAPTVSSISTTSSPPSGSTAGGTSVSITGTGFTNESTVNFILEVSGVPVGGPGVVPAGSVTVNSATSITAISPAVIAGTTYYVTVNTAGGTSAYSSSDVYTYATLTPTVLALTVATGPASGGTSTVLTGAGFFTGAVVDFVEESNGTASTPSVILASPSVTVTNSTTLTAITPAITTGSTYFVSVTTTGGTSTYGPIFSFVSTAPTVSVISPTSGPTTGGTTITLTGSGFFTGAEVFVIKETGGSPVAPPTVLAATNVNVNVLTGTSLTATTPAISSGTTYFVVVVTSYGESSYGPVFTY